MVVWGQLHGSLGTYDLQLAVNRIGRTAAKCDIVVPKPWISGLQCIIELRGTGDDKTVWLKDMSSNGVYINGDLVGKASERQIQENDNISFTKPSLSTPNVEPTIFKFKFAHADTRTTPSKSNKRKIPTPEPKAVIDSAKKLHVSSSLQRDELILGTEAMQKANQELRQRLVDAGKRESELKEQLQEMLITIQKKQQENDALQEEMTKARANALEHEHRRQEHDALEEKYRQLETKFNESELNLVREKEQHKQVAEELAAANRSALNMNDMVAMLKLELEEALAKASAANQKAQQLEVETQKLQHQLDSYHRASDNEQEINRGAKEEMLVMKARFAAAREAFHQMQVCMSTLGDQIDAHHGAADATEDGGEMEYDEDEETQCVLTERFAKYQSDDEEKHETTYTEPTTLHAEESVEATSPAPAVVVEETGKRWLQLKKDSPVASADDCGIFDESQDVRMN